MTKIDNLRTGKDNDKRRKLADKQREEIKRLYNGDNLPIREIARRYEDICSRRTIHFILFPEREAKLKKIIKLEKRWLKYYDKDKHREYMAKHRKRKRDLYNAGLVHNSIKQGSEISEKPKT